MTSGHVRVLEPVEFHGQELMVVDKDDQPYVAMRPVVEGMGMSWPAQYRKLIEEGERWGVAMIATPSQGGEQTALCLPLRKLMGWLMTLQPSRMAPEVADKVLVYQNECDDALWSYWSKGYAVNPRASIPADPTALGLPDFNDPIAAAEGWLVEAKGRRVAEAAAAQAQAQVRQLTAQVDQDAPRVAFAERVEASPTTHLVGAVAKMIQQGTGIAMGQNRLFVWLRENRYLHQTGSRTNQPTQRSLDAGWFVLQVRNVGMDAETRVTYTTRVTGKGLLHLYEQFYAMAVAMGLKPHRSPRLVTSAEVLRQLPLWEDEDRDGVDERLVAAARQLVLKS